MIKTNDKFSWDSEKRELNIQTRGLDFVKMADLVFSDPDFIIKHDLRRDYGEDRFNAFGLVDGLRLCLCFTPRSEKLHLITIFIVNKKDWEKHYEKKQ